MRRIQNEFMILSGRLPQGNPQSFPELAGRGLFLSKCAEMMKAMADVFLSASGEAQGNGRGEE